MAVKPGPEQYRVVVAAIMTDLSDRSGLDHLLSSIMDDTEVWAELEQSVGKLAWDAVEKEQQKLADTPPSPLGPTGMWSSS